jgi:uncharacterized linocin/CFP29 family protein
MNHLLRPLAPISDTGWGLLDDEARKRSVPALAARKLVDFSGPHGWQYSATNLGRTKALASAPGEGVSGRQRQVLPLVELRADFILALAQLRDADRGADDIDLQALDRAAHQMAVAENVAVFHGWPNVVTGIAEAAYEQAQLGEDADGYPTQVASALDRLLGNGIVGPYGLALGREQYRRVVETAEHGGYPLLEHLRKILEGPSAQLAGRRFRLRVRPGLVGWLRVTRLRSGAPLPGGKLQLPRGHARGCGSPETVISATRYM